jgi:hypothetical protein
MRVNGDGEVALSSADAQNIDIKSGQDLKLSTQAESGEIAFSHSGSPSQGKVNLRVRKDTVLSHVPVQAPAFSSPSDSRIKTDVQNVDEDDILQRMQGLEIKKYRYTEAWRNVRGIEDKEVRGLIAQDVAKKFPEYVETTPKYELKDKNFALDNFVQVNKQAIAIDLVAALQAQHKRFNVAKNAPVESGGVTVTSADAGSYRGALPEGGSVVCRYARVTRTQVVVEVCWCPLAAPLAALLALFGLLLAAALAVPAGSCGWLQAIPPAVWEVACR